MSQPLPENHQKEILDFQKQMNLEFADPTESPLLKKDLKKFKSLNFFPIDVIYRVEAQFLKADQSMPFEMMTTTGRKPIYEKYGEAHFELNGKTFVLTIYQSHSLREMEEFKSYLFLPFTDRTNGKGSYAGGRFIDLEIPEENLIVIDFNKAYNPYCAYNERYSCPIPPKENDLDIEIRAGVMAFKK